MKMTKKWFYGIATVTISALVITLNITNPSGKSNVADAIDQTSKEVKLNDTVVKASLQSIEKPQVEVSVNLEVEKGDQKNADKGSSPWKLDPIFVTQVFVSLQISPEGIQGDYPIKYEELNLVESTNSEAIVEVNSENTSIEKVYLKRLIKQDNRGIWTVVGYDNK